MYAKFVHHIKEIQKVEEENFESRPKLAKVKNLGENEAKANRILEKYLQKYKGISDIDNAVYAMGLAVVDMLGLKRTKVKQNEVSHNKSNRRERGKEHKIKELRQWIARADNEIFRRKIRRKASKKGKMIIKRKAIR